MSSTTYILYKPNKCQKVCGNTHIMPNNNDNFYIITIELQISLKYWLDHAKWVKVRTGVNGRGEGEKAAGAQTGLEARGPQLVNPENPRSGRFWTSSQHSGLKSCDCNVNII